MTSTTRRCVRRPRLEALELRAVPAVYTVDLAIDENDGNFSPGDLSLREAIFLANGDAAADTINFDPQVFAGDTTIFLNPALGQLSITAPLTINGTGKDLLAIRGDKGNVIDPPETRILDISPTANAVTVRDISLKGGNGDGDGSGPGNVGNGGVVLIINGVDATVTFERVSVLEGTATSGGGVYVEGGTLTLTDCQVEGDALAGSGGAAAVLLATLTATRTVFGGTAEVNGGAVFAQAVTLTLDECIATAKALTGSGGGLYLNGGTFTITNKTNIDRCQAITGAGGGIYLHAGDLTLKDASIVGRSLAEISGGGIFAAGGTLTVYDSTISKNASFLAQLAIGGGIYSAVPTVIQRSTIEENQAVFGGGIAMESAGAWLDLKDCTIGKSNQANPVPGFEHAQGGGLWINSVSTTRATILYNSRFVENTATEGGGLYVSTAGEVLIDGCTFDANVAAPDVVDVNASGGGMTLDASPGVTITNSTFENNRAYSDFPETFGIGAGLYFANGGSNQVINSTFSGHVADKGGAVAIQGASSLDNPQFYNCTVYGNTATGESIDTPNIAAEGGGFLLLNFSGNLRLDSTIVALNTVSDTPLVDTGPDIRGPGKVNAFASLVGVADDGGFTQGDGWGSDVLRGSDTLPLDPQLRPLANNGGLVRTHAPIKDNTVTSIVIDVGRNELNLTTDGRGGGFARVVQGKPTADGGSLKADIGAFELQRWASVTSLDTYAENAVSKVANTHSRITSIVVTFSEPVTLSDPAEDAFRFVKLNPNPGDVLFDADPAGNVVTFTFLSHTEAADTFIRPSLVDGNYQLKILAQLVTSFGANLDGDGDGFAGGDFATAGTGESALYRFFGDALGDDRTVDAMDYGEFRAAYGSQGAVFDFDGDGDVDASDWGAFKQRQFTTLDLP
jgi:hypothetical protein